MKTVVMISAMTSTKYLCFIRQFPIRLYGYKHTYEYDYYTRYLPDTIFDAASAPEDLAEAAAGFVQPYADSPLDNEHVGENVYMSLAESAKDYVWFMTPYLLITDEMDSALGLAAKRGVDVRIVTPGIPDKKLVYQLTRSYYASLVRNGVRIFEYTPGFCHAKMSVADDEAATCGTINMDYRSLYHHFENGCIMYKSPAVLEIKKDFYKLAKEKMLVNIQPKLF